MSDDLRKILSNLNQEVEQEKLLQYLNRQLDEKDLHALEEQMTDDPFLNDAIEGLENMRPGSLSATVNELNKGLQQQIEKSKKRRNRKSPVDSWMYYTIILVLLLIIVGYIVIRLVLKK